MFWYSLRVKIGVDSATQESVYGVRSLSGDPRGPDHHRPALYDRRSRHDAAREPAHGAGVDPRRSAASRALWPGVAHSAGASDHPWRGPAQTPLVPLRPGEQARYPWTSVRLRDGCYGVGTPASPAVRGHGSAL